MKLLDKLVLAATLFAAGAALLVLPEFAASSSQDMAGMHHETSSDEPTPAFHAEAPKDPLPATMEPSLYSDNILTFNAYSVAGRIKKVLYQEPCYCHCDRSQGHGSLLDCFASRHGSGCEICQKEAFYSYEQTRKGKTPAQIRAAIMKGDWQKVETAKYAKAFLPPSNSPAK